MKYMSCFLKEVMRDYTPVTVVSRTLNEPVIIDDGVIPKGTIIDLGIHSVHHNPDVRSDFFEKKKYVHL